MEKVILQKEQHSHWYIWYTHPRAEKKIKERLQAKGVEVFLPLNRELRQWSDRKKWVEEPLFKGYIFTKILPKQLDSVAQTEGLLTWLRFDGKPAYLKDEQVEEIQKLLSCNKPLEISSETLQSGEPVYIMHGPLAGLAAEVINFRGSKKLLVRIEQLGRHLLVELPAACVQAQRRA